MNIRSYTDNKNRRFLVGIMSFGAILASGCGPEGAGSVHVPSTKNRRETSRTGTLPDPKTGAGASTVRDVSKQGPGQSATYRLGKVR